MRESIQLMQAGEEQIGQVFSSGDIVDLNEGMVVHYRLNIEMLEGVIAKLECEET